MSWQVARPEITPHPNRRKIALVFDRRTDSPRNRFTGKPVAGPLIGRGIESKTLPVAVTSRAEWRRRHPDTKVLSLETGHRCHSPVRAIP